MSGFLFEDWAKRGIMDCEECRAVRTEVQNRLIRSHIVSNIIVTVIN